MQHRKIHVEQKKTTVVAPEDESHIQLESAWKQELNGEQCCNIDLSNKRDEGNRRRKNCLSTYEGSRKSKKIRSCKMGKCSDFSIHFGQDGCTISHEGAQCQRKGVTSVEAESTQEETANSDSANDSWDRESEMFKETNLNSLSESSDTTTRSSPPSSNRKCHNYVEEQIVKEEQHFYREESNLCCFSAPVLQNIVASAHLSCVIDLRELSVSTRNAEYNPSRLNAVIFRLQSPKCTALVFRTGRILITGARSETEAMIGSRTVGKLIKRVRGAESENAVVYRDFRIESLIATADCCSPVRLEGLANDHKEFCSYEPEIFAGLVYRYNPTESLKAVLLIFVSGKIIITGCKSNDEVLQVWENMYPVLIQYCK